MENAFSGVTAEPRRSAVGTLDRAVLALKEFIDGLAKGEANAPIKLFPVYREISSLQGKADVSEKDLFYPDLSPAALHQWMQREAKKIGATIDRHAVQALLDAKLGLPGGVVYSPRARPACPSVCRW